MREVFLVKKREAVNLPAYQQQMIDIERTFGTLLRQLPNKSQMDGLLTDINQVGLERGLEFELFKPGQERVAEFYAEMPISIKVTGDYFDLGAFAVGISKLPRIVTLNDLKIAPIAGKDGKLGIELVAKTFRYLDASEMAPKKEKKAKRSSP
ncbi:pilus assembly protein, PilO [mine drainage metagenome]|uniref:Pilus assembly protein, PilO n=1 Tax=mine drainage metagenome TaxID=410659 RepID=A0A1J5QVJ5_9ZZZZ